QQNERTVREWISDSYADKYHCTKLESQTIVRSKSFLGRAPLEDCLTRRSLVLPSDLDFEGFVALRHCHSSSSYLFGASFSRFSKRRRISPSSISFFKLT